MKEKMIKVFDIHIIPHRGIAIGGTNAALDRLSRWEIQTLIGKQIEIHTLENILYADVVDVDVTSSLIGKKNIFILLSQINLMSLKKAQLFTVCIE
jgi:hypothetical protein